MSDDPKILVPTVDPGTGLLRRRGGAQVDHGSYCNFCLLDYPIDDRAPEHHINPKTKVWPIEEWGNECARGFVRHERFAGQTGAQVIPGTNRTQQRKRR